MELVQKERMPEPSVTGSYKYGWQQLRKHFLHFFLAALILLVFQSPVSVIGDGESGLDPLDVGLAIMGMAYALLVLPVIEFGADYIFLRGIRNESTDPYLLFEGFHRNYLNIILSSLLTFVLIGIGILFLIVPGIILACRLVFVSYLVMDKGLDPVGAIEKSWEMTRGYGWTIFGMALMAIPVFLAGLLLCFVGAFFSGMWISASFAALYHALDRSPTP